MSHFRYVALACALLQVLPGCTVVGLAVGTATPRSEPIAPVELESLPPHTELVVDAEYSAQRTSSGWRSERAKEPLEGTLLCVEGPNLVILTSSGERTIPISRIHELRVRNGDYGAEGLAVGLLADALFFLAASQAANRSLDKARD